MDYLVAIPDQLAPQLRSLRKARRLSQTDLARTLGLTQPRIAEIERNPTSVGVGHLLKYLHGLGVALVLRDTLVQGAPVPQPPATPQGEW